MSIVEKMVCQGAGTVIGFKTSTTVDACNEFVKDLVRIMLVEKKTVSEAFEMVPDRIMNVDGVSVSIKESCIIAGKGDYRFN